MVQTLGAGQWTAPESIAASDKVASLLDRRAALLDNEAVENCAAYTTRIAEARMRHTRRTRT